MGMAAAVLAQAKPGDAAAAHGGQGKGSMAGAFLCLVARLPSVLSPAASSVCAPGHVARCMCTGHLCPWSYQCWSGWGRIHPRIQADEHCSVLATHPASANSSGPKDPTRICLRRIEMEGVELLPFSWDQGQAKGQLISQDGAGHTSLASCPSSLVGQ